MLSDQNRFAAMRQAIDSAQSSTPQPGGKDLAKQRQEPAMSKAATLESKTQTLQQQLTTLKSKLQTKEKELAARDERCTEQTKKITELQKDMAALESDMNRSYNQTLDELMKHVSSLSNSLKDKEKEAGELQGLANRAQEEKRVYEEKVQQLEKRLASWKTQQGEQGNVDQPKVRELESVLASLKKQLQNKDKLIADYEAKSAVQEKKIAELHQEKRDLEGQLNKSYNQTLDELINQIDELGKRLGNSNKEIEALQVRAESAEKEKLVHQSKSAQLAKELAALKEARASSVATDTTDEVSLDDVSTEMAGLESRLTVATGVAEFLMKSVTRSEEEKKEVEDKAVTLQSQLEGIQSTLHKREGDVHERQFHLQDTKRILKFVEDNLVRATTLNKTLQAQVDEATVEISGLKAELLDKEGELSNKNFRLSDTTRVLKYTQSELNKMQEEKKTRDVDFQAKTANTEFRLKETERVLKYTQANLSKTVEEKKTNELNLSGEVSQLRFRITESGRVMKFLHANLEKTAEGKRATEAKAKQLETELTALKAELKACHADIRNGKVTSASQTADIEVLTRKIVDHESRLTVTQRVGDFLQTTLAKTVDEKKSVEDKAAQLEARVSALEADLRAKDGQIAKKNFQVHEVSRMLKFTQSTLDKTKEEKATTESELRKDLAQKDFGLTNTKQVLRFTQSTLQKTQAEKAANETEMTGEIKQLTFRLTETQRILKFVQANLEKTTKGKEMYEEKAKELEAELAAVKAELEAREAEIEAGKIAAEEQAQKMEDLAAKATDLKSRLSVTNRISDYLQSTVTKAEGEKAAAEQHAQELQVRINSLESQLLEKDGQIAKKNFQVHEVSRMLKFTESTLVKTKEEKSATEAELRKDLAQKDFGLTNTKQVLRFTQHALEKTQTEKKGNEQRLNAEVAQLKFKLTETQRVMKFVQSNLEKTLEGKRLSDLRSKGFEEEIAKLQADLEAREAEISSSNELTTDQSKQLGELTEKVTDLTSRLEVTSRVAEFLQSTLMKAEAESQEAKAEVQSLMAQLSGCKREITQKDGEIAKLNFRLTEQMRVAKFRQDKAEQVERGLHQQLADANNLVQLMESKADQSTHEKELAEEHLGSILNRIEESGMSRPSAFVN